MVPPKNQSDCIVRLEGETPCNVVTSSLRAAAGAIGVEEDFRTACAIGDKAQIAVGDGIAAVIVGKQIAQVQHIRARREVGNTAGCRG